MTATIDCVAMAIHKAIGTINGDEAAEAARAAIEAMREPTEEMIEAGARILDMDAAEDAYHSPFSARRIVEEIYRAMIDEALK